ncbi:MAG TPA: hypothetical protein PK948_08215, partial [Gemmatimonadales bacterium]|nr:hypothetical protein [Gemmatimonadales bacterium]
ETAREVESLRAERDTWRMLGTALADHLYAHNSVTHPNVLTVITAISRYSRDKPLESATPITIEAPYCTHPAASKVVFDV